ncbi:uncharacterized protein BX663DRAFT_499567 [Cokeromyces recurvatus]|uniref:uncharacterized protein n=1 Tax=Cokeromyces recurvatus TaxID=90255 RepID=UPI0022211B8E|nr:uncharacterized protein BX663DRAFT_499567 [Cokeromyces recurvatus]KAI7905394.1 hypothetical protein BX663DRAFT_499567 [Cokeromyces recurvatus]
MTSYSKNDVFRIVVAVDNSLVSKEAIQYAINLCTKLKTSYTLDILYAVGLNPSTTPFGLLNKLDRMNNVDLQEDAKETIKELNEYLAKFDETKTKELIVKEDSKDIEYIIEDYINQNPPNMLIMGSTNKEGLQK